MHDAKADELLSEEDSVLFCTSCHAKGSGADTAVMEGALIRPTVPGGDVFTDQGTLLGGGFNNIGNKVSVTSNHRLGEAGTPFGSDANATVVLTCLSCHTPHQGPNYRLLRRRPTGGDTDLYVTWNGPWSDETQTQHQDGGYMAYTETYFGSGLTRNPSNNALEGEPIEYTRNYQSGMSDWCSGCHSVYSTEVGPYDIGDGQGSMIRHKHLVDITLTNTGRLAGSPDTNLPLSDPEGTTRDGNETINCLTCHRAHGTDTDSTDIGAYQAASRGFLPPMTTSMLLRRGNRGVCIDCHGYINN